MSGRSLAASLVLVLSGAGAVRAQEEAPRPRRFEVEAGFSRQGIFDPGIHFFSGDSYVPGVSLGVRRLLSEEARVVIEPEAVLSMHRADQDLGAGSSASLSLALLDLGARARARLLPSVGVDAFLRADAVGIYGRGTVTESAAGYIHDALAFGARLGAGARWVPADAAGRAAPVSVYLEADELAATPLSFASWGALTPVGLGMSGGVDLRF